MQASNQQEQAWIYAEMVLIEGKQHMCTEAYMCQEGEVNSIAKDDATKVQTEMNPDEFFQEYHRDVFK